VQRTTNRVIYKLFVIFKFQKSKYLQLYAIER